MRIARLLAGRDVDAAIRDEDDMTDAQEQCRPASIATEIRAEALRREADARVALARLRRNFHDTDQPLTVAKVKASMLKRMEDRD